MGGTFELVTLDDLREVGKTGPTLILCGRFSATLPRRATNGTKGSFSRQELKKSER